MPRHVRDNRSWLAEREKRALIWMARRVPARIHSDHLTVVALTAMVLTAVGFVAARWDRRSLALVVVGLVLNWCGDSLDGTLARVRGLERPRYGYYVDHVLDIVGTAVLMVGLACSGFMSPIMALTILALYLLVAAEVYLATAVHGVFRMSFLGVGPTELRLILIAGTAALFRDPGARVELWGGHPALFDVGGGVAACGLGVALLVGIVRNTRDLARAEPRRAWPAGGRANTPPSLNSSAAGSTIEVLQVSGNS